MSEFLGDLENQKFTKDADGKTSVRVTPKVIGQDGKSELDINADNRLLVEDDRGTEMLNHISDTLEKIHYQLTLITGA